ncbi:MAG: archaeal proteasome endopeptidase complex subunit alpha [Nitrososphaerota archaeon]|jgi:proteasome alpha subunit|nr:archaeal proteasome endopeptidase complex subunit alpha [Nitrososphaerota archaeon]
MSAFAKPGAYDYNATVFSPDGRLYQVEYITELINRGATIVGIKCPEGIVLASEEITELFEETEHSLKIFQIDCHVGAAIVGLGSDARVLIQKAREEAQGNKLTFDEPVAVETITKKCSDTQQVYTQHGGGRPFGVALIIGGVDATGPHLFCTHQSGTYKAYKAIALGTGREIVQTQLTQQYRENMTLNESIQLALACLKNAIQTKQATTATTSITIATIPTTTKTIQILHNSSTEEKTPTT